MEYMDLSKTISMFQSKVNSSENLKNDKRYSKYSVEELAVIKMKEFKRRTLGICGQSTVKPFYELDGILKSIGLSNNSDESLEILASFDGAGLPRGIGGYLGISKVCQTDNFYNIGLYARNAGPK